MSLSLSPPDDGPRFLTPNDPLIEGAYALERGMLARIGNVRDNGHGPACEANYVHHRYDGEVTSGGASMWHARDSFEPITNPKHILLAFADHARRMQEQAERDTRNAADLYRTARLALNAIKLATTIADDIVIASATPPAPKES